MNALHVYPSGKLIMSGDHKGNMKLWSTVTGTCVKTQCMTSGKPISHLSATRPGTSDDNLLAVNCYDNVLRV